MARLTAIVPATDARPTLDRCITAIRSAASPPEEIIVVTEGVAGNSARVRNEGARRAQGDVLVFVDSDVEIHSDAFVRIREQFERNSDLAALFGSYDDAPPGSGVAAFRNLLHHHVHHACAGYASTFWTGIGAVRRSAFEGTGGFDENLDWIADIEFGSRLAASGNAIVLDPSIQGTHLKAWSLGEMIRTDFARRGIPWVLLLLEGRAPSSALNLGWHHRASAAVSLAAAAALCARRGKALAVATVTLVVLNRAFYALLLRRRGPVEAAAGVGLHALHHVVAAASVPAGFALHLVRRKGELRAGEAEAEAMKAHSLVKSPNRPGASDRSQAPASPPRS